MKIHHLNCATMCPRMGRLINEQRRMVCHCLLVESNAGLILVDTGLGTEDVADPARLGAMFPWLTGARLDHDETARARVEALGHAITDVTHIVVTHLDLDHAGGLPDFPRAQVHVHGVELAAAQKRASRMERRRYLPTQWAHGPTWVVYGESGEDWYGFESIRAVPETDDEILLVPLFGHTRGHVGVAVRGDDRWILHCGDAYFHHGEVDPWKARCPLGLRVFQRAIAMDNAARLANQRRLRALASEQSERITLLSAHDPIEFDRLAGVE